MTVLTSTPSDARVIDPAGHPFRWAMLGGVWLIYFSFGLLSASMAPLVARITADLEISHTAMGSILGAWPLVYIVVAIPCGAFVDRVGLKWSLFLAALIMATSGGLRAVAPDFWTMFLAVGIFGIGGPLISIGAPKAIAQWFKGPERGLAMGIYITGPALGSVLSLSLTNSVLLPLVGGEWRSVLLVHAGLVVAAGFAWLLVAMNPINRAVEATHRRRGSMGEQIAVFGTLLRIPSVVLVLMMSVGIFFFYHGMGNWLPELLRHGGMAPSAAGLWASLPVIVGIVGSLVVPRLATPGRRFAILLILFVSIALGAILLFSPAMPSIVASLIVQGLGRGSLMAVAMLILMETRGVEAQHMGAAGGLFFSAAEIGGVLGPLTIGMVSDLTGGFDGALWMMIAISGALVLLLFAHRAAERRAALLAGAN
ncbi:MAG: MFS transporter [Alphaproteobacteria bacterium]